MTLGLVLTGGGARGAYQAGALQAVVEIAAELGQGMPFRVITGASAGAVNACFLAASADRLAEAAPKLTDFWASLRSREIFRTDALSLSRIGLKWASDLALGRLKRRKVAQALLDTGPLRRLIGERVRFERIAPNIKRGALDALEVTATDYQTSESVSFVMSRGGDASWARARRRAFETRIGLDHVMASSAIPLLFPPVSIHGRHYGDGCLRNPAPLSPAVRLGARRLLIVGLRQNKNMCEINAGVQVNPTIGRVLSVVLNSVLMDTTEFDIERLGRINEIIQSVPAELRPGLPKHEIDFVHLTPSIDLGAYASEHFDRLPDLLRHLISGLGSRDEASELVSYLLFEPEYTGYLARVGYKDAQARRDEIAALLTANGEAQHPTKAIS